MDKIYIVCLAVGVIFTLLSFLINGILDGLDLDISLDFLGLPIKLTSIMAATTTAGGVGYLTISFIRGIPLAIASWLITYFLFTYLFYVILPKYQTETKSQAEAIGLDAEVTVTIFPGKLGKISYVVDGNILSSLAQEANDGNGIKKGTKVKIVALAKDSVLRVMRYPVEEYIESTN